MTYETHLFFQSIRKFMQIPIMQKNIEKTFFDFEIIEFELVSLDTRFLLRENTCHRVSIC